LSHSTLTMRVESGCGFRAMPIGIPKRCRSRLQADASALGLGRRQSPHAHNTWPIDGEALNPLLQFRRRLSRGHCCPLTPAAMNAVRQWVYQPTLLNGAPVEVVTQIVVTFALSKRGWANRSRGARAEGIPGLVRVQLGVERPQANTQNLRRPAFIIVRMFQDQPDIRFFHFAH
jgi:hypothetical protein